MGKYLIIVILFFSLGLLYSKDIDECNSSPCLNGATCIDGAYGYMCSCMAGYNGELCETDINECQSSPCQHDATCTDNVHGYTCSCLPGYAGINCELDINECESTRCQNNGTCNDNVNGFTCQCTIGYNGKSCELDTDECVSLPCENNGTCTDKVNGYTCTCIAGYDGKECQNVITVSRIQGSEKESLLVIIGVIIGAMIITIGVVAIVKRKQLSAFFRKGNSTPTGDHQANKSTIQSSSQGHDNPLYFYNETFSPS